MIGIFDSGVGGLTVVKEIFKYLPDYQIIYFGDTARLPYGTKGENFVKRYSSKISQWLIDNNVQIIVVGCHTSSAWAADSLKEKFDVPVFEMITPAIKDIIEATRNNRVGIIGTPGTIKSASFKKKLLEKDSNLKVYSQDCPLFVPLAEEGLVDGKITSEIIEKYLNPLKEKRIDTLVLACTHYPLLEKSIEQVMGDNIKIINPAVSVAKNIKVFLESNFGIQSKIEKGSDHQFFFSDEPYNFEKISHLCFDRNIKIEINDPF